MSLKFKLDDIKKLYRECADKEKVLMDVKGIHKVEELNKSWYEVLEIIISEIYICMQSSTGSRV